MTHIYLAATQVLSFVYQPSLSRVSAQQHEYDQATLVSYECLHYASDTLFSVNHPTAKQWPLLADAVVDFVRRQLSSLKFPKG